MKYLIQRLTNIRIKTLIITMIGIIFTVMLSVNLLLHHASLQELQTQAQIYFSGICAQLEQKVYSDCSNMTNAVDNITGDAGLQEYLMGSYDYYLHKAFTKNLNSMAQMNHAIVMAKIYSGNSTLSMIEDSVAAFSFMQLNIPLTDDAFTKPYYTPIFTDFEEKYTYCAYISPILSTLSDNFRQRIGTMVVVLDMEEILDMGDPDPIFASASCLVFDAGLDVVYNPNHLENPWDILSVLSPDSDALQQIQYNNQQYYAIMARIGQPEWQLLITVPVDILNNQGQHITLITATLSVLCLLVVVGLAGLMLLNLYHPIRDMVQDMAHIRRNGHAIRVKPPGNNELGILADGINSLLDDLQQSAALQLEAQNDLYQLQLSEQRSQFLALQSQINPHFLFNTLDCIQGIALEHKALDIMAITSALAYIYRYACAPEMMVPLARELDCAQRYLEIMRNRFGHQTKLLIDVPEPMKEHMIPRMTLQPLIENAFMHGLERVRGNGDLRIRAYSEGDAFFLAVENSGGKLTQADADEINARLSEAALSPDEVRINNGLALTNITRRLYLMGKHVDCVTVSVPRPEYVQVLLRIQ